MLPSPTVFALADGDIFAIAIYGEAHDNATRTAVTEYLMSRYEAGHCPMPMHNPSLAANYNTSDCRTGPTTASCNQDLCAAGLTPYLGGLFVSMRLTQLQAVLSTTLVAGITSSRALPCTSPSVCTCRLQHAEGVPQRRLERARLRLPQGESTLGFPLAHTGSYS